MKAIYHIIHIMCKLDIYNNHVLYCLWFVTGVQFTNSNLVIINYDTLAHFLCLFH